MFDVLCDVYFVSHALQCYQCNYCQDPFNKNEANIINCTGSCEKSKKNDGMLNSMSGKIFVKTVFNINNNIVHQYTILLNDTRHV